MPPKARILVMQHRTNACGYYRGLVPARIWASLGYEVMTRPSDKSFRSWMKPTPPVWLERLVGQFDLVVTERLWDLAELGMIRGFVHRSPDRRLLIDFDDDFHNVTWWNEAYDSFQPGQACRRVGDMTLKVAECCSVTCDGLKKAFEPFAHRIVVAGNFIDPRDWLGFPQDPSRAADPHIRIFYGGAGQHYGDLDEVRAGLEAFLRKPPTPVRLLCLGTGWRSPRRGWNGPWRGRRVGLLRSSCLWSWMRAEDGKRIRRFPWAARTSRAVEHYVTFT